MWPLADGSRGAPLSLDGTYYMTSVPDGLLINTHPLKTYRKNCAESPEILTPLQLVWHIFFMKYWGIAVILSFFGQKLKCCLYI